MGFISYWYCYVFLNSFLFICVLFFLFITERYAPLEYTLQRFFLMFRDIAIQNKLSILLFFFYKLLRLVAGFFYFDLLFLLFLNLFFSFISSVKKLYFLLFLQLLLFLFIVKAFLFLIIKAYLLFQYIFFIYDFSIFFPIFNIIIILLLSFLDLFNLRYLSLIVLIC